MCTEHFQAFGKTKNDMRIFTSRWVQRVLKKKTFKYPIQPGLKVALRGTGGNSIGNITDYYLLG